MSAWLRHLGVLAGIVLSFGPLIHSAAGASRTYIGTLPSEPPAQIALVIEGNQFLAYACGATNEFNQAHSAWLKGTIEGGKLSATADGKTLTASFDGRSVKGTLTGEQGRDREFVATPTTRSPIAGLYRAVQDVQGDPHVVGWIINEKHQIVGGCQSKKKKPFAVQPPVNFPPPPQQSPPQPVANPEQVPPAPQPQPEAQQAAEEVLITQFDPEPDQGVQAQKVESPTQLPNGRVVRVIQKKKK